MSASQPMMLDLVFACDCTGSMGSYIHQAKQNILKIVQDIVSSEKCDVEFALVEYRDHPPQDSTFAARVSPFTKSHKKMQEYVNAMSADGGGDGPESVTEALHEALNLPWRKESAKVVVLISDAPPHGLGESGDGFPDGDPTGRDPLEIAHEMARQGIVIYAVGVEPALSGFKFGRDFMMALAQITDGQFLPLTNANLLATVVIGGAVEEVSMAQLMDQVRLKSEELESEGLAEEEVKVKVAEWMQEQNVETNQLEVDNIYAASYNYANRDALVAAANLRSVKDTLIENLNPLPNQSHSVSSSRRRSTVWGCDDDEDCCEVIADEDDFEECESEELRCDEIFSSVESAAVPEPKAQSAAWSKKKISVEQAYKMHSRYVKSKK